MERRRLPDALADEDLEPTAVPDDSNDGVLGGASSPRGRRAPPEGEVAEGEEHRVAGLGKRRPAAAWMRTANVSSMTFKAASSSGMKSRSEWAACNQPSPPA